MAKSTYRSYERNLKRVEAALGAMLIKDIEAADIVDLIERTDVGWVETNTLLIVNKAVFRRAAGKRLINSNPAVGIELSAVIGARQESR